jgi:hypothetical protein
MTNEIVNLDAVCAEHAYTIVKGVAPTGELSKGDKSELENTITKSLGVLQEQGVYAFFLFLEYRTEKPGAKQTVHQSWELLRTAKLPLKELPKNNRVDWVELRKLTEKLDDLLLARELLEQTLIYARYHAKALGVKTEQKENQQAEGTTA